MRYTSRWSALILAATVAGCGSGSDESGSAKPDAASGPDGLEACLVSAGAKVAKSASDLRFAAGTGIGTGAETDIAAVVGGIEVTSFKPSDNSGWRLYFGKPEGSPALSYSAVLKDPTSAEVAAYIPPGSGVDPAKADDCLDS